MELTCPACGHSGEVKGTEEFFEVRGQWPDGHLPVRKCRACGAGIIVKLGLRKARAKLIDADTWDEMQLRFDAAMARHDAGVHGDGFDARNAAMSPAADALDSELQEAPVDGYFALILLACAWGGYQALQAFCNTVEDVTESIDDPPALALVAAIPDPVAGDRAVRAAAWVMATCMLARSWPDRHGEVLDVARLAMPVEDDDFAALRHLADLTVEELAAEDEDTATARYAQFSRQSLEYVIAATTGNRPSMGDMLFVIPRWAECFTHGLTSFDEHLDELKENNPDLVP